MSQTTEFKGGKRKAAIGFIWATALMDVISLGIMIPVLPNLVRQFVDGSYTTASHYTGIFGTAWALMQFVCSPIIGLMSDRFGRRPVLLISIAGLGVDFVFMALAPTLALLFIGRLINGVTAASFSTASAYVADITEPKDRARAFGMMGAAWGFGFVIGPVIGGTLGDINLRLPFYVAAAMALVNWLYGCFVLPESLPKERRAKEFDWRKANPLGSLQLLSSAPGLVRLAIVNFLFHLAHNILPALFVLYTGYRYNWGPREVGLMLMATGVGNIFVQALLVRRVVKKIGERGALLSGLAMGAIGFAIYGLAATPAAYFCGMPVFALMGLAQPGLQGLMSQRVGPSQQGQLQGANASIMGLTGMIGPTLFTSTFAWAVAHNDSLHMPGLPVLIASALLVAGLTIAVGVTPRESSS